MARRATPAKYSRQTKGKKSKIGLAAASLLLVLCCFVGLTEWLDIPLPSWLSQFGGIRPEQSQGISLPVETPEGSLLVHFLDVGQGDCALVQCDGKNLLIDAGEPGNEEKILSYLDSLQVSRLDYVIATHPHADHIGSMGQVLSHVSSIGTVFLPDLPDQLVPTTRAYEKMMTVIEERADQVIAATALEQYALGEANLLILGPSGEYDDLNNYSVVCKIAFGECEFLFTGDAEERAEKDILNLGANLKATVLKAGHHGSNTSTSSQFLQAVSPAYAVISCGEGNRYGHPDQETLEKLEAASCQILRTDQKGTILFTIEDGVMSVSTET